MELVSTIIPAYNAAPYIREALDSALTQTYKEHEIIVVDDGSTDRTPEILAEYGNRLRVVHQPGKGSAAARNAGVSVANGKWVCFLDADDEWLPDKLALQIEGCAGTAISHTDSLCFGDSIAGEVLRSSFEPLYSGQVVRKLLVVNFITMSTVMIRRDVFNEYGGFDETFVTCEDWHFWLRVCAENDLGYVPEALARYRVHQKSKSMLSRRTLIARRRIVDEAFGPGGVGQSLPKLRNHALASAYQVTCHFAAQSGDWTFAINCALHALRHDPTVVRTWKNLVKAALIPLGVKY